MTRLAMLGFALCLSATSAFAETLRIPSRVPVADAISNMTAAIESAGARVFTTVDYQAGSKRVGNTLRPTTVIIFGSPKIGADALTIGQTMGLYLPLRVLAYEDATGDVWLIYEDPAAEAAKHGIPADHPAIAMMQKALQRITKAAAGNS